MSPTMTWFTSHTGKQVTTDTRQHVPGHTANVCQSWPCLYILASTPVSSLLLISWLQEWTSASDSVHDQCLCLTAKVLNVVPYNSSLSSHAPPTSVGTLYFRWEHPSPCLCPSHVIIFTCKILCSLPHQFSHPLFNFLLNPHFSLHACYDYSTRTHLPFLFSYHILATGWPLTIHSYTVSLMVNFLGQFHWATGNSDSGLNIISGCVYFISKCSCDDVSRRDQCLNW